MTTKSALDYLRQMPHSYFKLAMRYVVSRNEINRINAPCDSIPKALERLSVWLPRQAKEGYEFWANLYYHYSGLNVALPVIPNTTIAVLQKEVKGHYYMEVYNRANLFKLILENLFVPMKPSRKREQVYMRMIMINELCNGLAEKISLFEIGRVVALVIDRRAAFNHSTIIWNLSTHKDLLEVNDKMYSGMYERFKQALDKIESHLNRPVETESVEQFEPEFGC